jgi:hypothetical protein
MIHEPPDVLFTTMEMVNRRLSRTQEHRLFGVGAAIPPYLVLLDEIHTYEGLHGAQVAYLVRRWRHARGAHGKHGICFVGLSATLTGAEEFFSKLTGVPAYDVSYVSPRVDDLVSQGAEYNLVLKGDPVSGTSLLSTSVQTAMLLGRMLDSRHSYSGDKRNVSRGAFGQRTFAFTDKLDVINRWYHIERDAENDDGKLKPLSRLRDKPLNAESTLRQRNEQGQYWWAPKEIGWKLQRPFHVDLTSSQYRGVELSADLVIATSTLEVGFNDPTVGAILQHKAPRSVASFLQRKGRAGRRREMRPWMVLTTSSYGRDRWAFQHAEQVFDPLLSSMELPVDNYYVRKIQGAYALMDWLALQLKEENIQVDVWDALVSDERHRNDTYSRQRAALAKTLHSLLLGHGLKGFETYLKASLNLEESPAALHSILWEEPRPLMYHVVPTILRQLESDWQAVSAGKALPWKDAVSGNPMPEFVTVNLFSDLNAPDLVLHIPDAPKKAHNPYYGKGKYGKYSGSRFQAQNSSSEPEETRMAVPMRDDEYLPLAQGMVEFAPGHVNKRFSRKDLLDEAHWLKLPDEAQLLPGVLPLEDLSIDRDNLPLFLTVDDTEIRVFRPWAYTLALVPPDVRNTSTGRLLWQSHFEPRSASTPSKDEENAHVSQADPAPDEEGIPQVHLNPASLWQSVFSRIRVYTRTYGSWVDITRLAIGVTVDTRFEGGGKRHRTFHFEESHEPAALGFQIGTDAICFDYLPLDAPALRESSDWSGLYRHIGPQFFLFRLQQDERLHEEQVSSFDIEWLWQLHLSMLVATATAQQCTLQDAAVTVAVDRAALAERTMEVIFQAQQVQETSEDEKEKVGRLHERMLGFMQDPVVISTLEEHEQVLWDSDAPDLTQWLEAWYASSLGSTLHAALSNLVPDVDPDELHMDLDVNRIWISEAAAGGVGLVSRIADALSLRPRDFDLQMEDTVEHCDRQQLSVQLETVASAIYSGNTSLAHTFEEVRSSSAIQRYEDARKHLTDVLGSLGLPVTRELLVSLNTKFLRPNSGPDSDSMIAELVHRWKREEERIGTEIDLRVMAVASVRLPELRILVEKVLQRVSPGSYADEAQLFNVLQSLLWLRCADSCPDCIGYHSVYQSLVSPSRGLLISLLKRTGDMVSYRAYGWRDEVLDALSHTYRVRVACRPEDVEDCQRDLVELLVSPVEVGYQVFYPVVDRVSRRGSLWLIDLMIRELLRA